LIIKDDVILHGDWGSRKIHNNGAPMIGKRMPVRPRCIAAASERPLNPHLGAVSLSQAYGIMFLDMATDLTSGSLVTRNPTTQPSVSTCIKTHEYTALPSKKPPTHRVVLLACVVLIDLAIYIRSVLNTSKPSWCVCLTGLSPGAHTL
jgi:hypothetical protein